MSVDDEQSSAEGRVTLTGGWFRVSGPQSVVILTLTIVMLLVGGVLYAGQIRIEQQHATLIDLWETTLWVNLPDRYRDHMAPPRWVRQRLEEVQRQGERERVR